MEGLIEPIIRRATVPYSVLQQFTRMVIMKVVNSAWRIDHLIFLNSQIASFDGAKISLPPLGSLLTEHRRYAISVFANPVISQFLRL